MVSFVDRKKDLVKLSTGEYISLGKVEGALKQIPCIDNCCAYVNGEHAYGVVLVIPNPKHLKTLAATVGVITDSMEELCNDKKVVKALLGAIESASKGGKFYFILYMLDLAIIPFLIRRLKIMKEIIILY